MTTTTITAIRGADLLTAATNFGPEISKYTRQHDDEGSFVTEGFELLRSSGYLASPVPEDLGGGGATTIQVAFAQRELARHCSSTALASTMHLHVILANAWRYRRGLPGAEPMLRKVAADGVFVASTGGGDFTMPTGVARRADGGWKISGRKSFVSGSPIAALASTWATTEDGEAIAFGVRFDEPGVSVVENWDAPGMRGTASHDLVFDDVFIADERVTAKRTPGEFAPVLAIVAAKALTVIAATYLGIADGVRDEVVARLAGTERANDPGVRRTVGAIDEHNRSARWILDGVLTELGEDPEPTPQTMSMATLAKRSIIEHARESADLAMDVMGGRSYRRGDLIERSWRDLRAGPFHPLDHELTLRFAGDVALDNSPSLR